MAAFQDAEVLDITGPLDVFSIAGRVLLARGAKQPPYTIEIVASQTGPVATSSGIRLFADRSFREVSGGVDTLMIPGGEGTSQAMDDIAFIRWIQGMATRVRRVCSVCTGALILAEAGVLDRRRAFLRTLGVPPGSYRDRFRRAAELPKFGAGARQTA